MADSQQRKIGIKLGTEDFHCIAEVPESEVFKIKEAKNQRLNKPEIPTSPVTKDKEKT